MQDQQENNNELLQIRKEKLQDLQNQGADPFLQTKYESTEHAADIIDRFDDLEGMEVSLAGRLMSKRGMGKASFSDLQDQTGRIQCYIKLDEVGEPVYQQFKKWDIGDIFGIQGEVFKTHRGEISIKAKKLTLLAKSLRPLPEKWHGLNDTDMRYRQRYLDMIVHPQVRDTFIKRSKIITEIRRFLDSQAFLEVETPVLHTMAGGAAARPFKTHHNALNLDMYMRIALELHLKRLLVGGMERVYEIGRVFRNEGTDTKHNPEFTLLELYQAYTDIHGMMDITEQMIRTVAQNVLGTTRIPYSDGVIDVGSPFQRMSMIDAVKQYAKVDFSKIHSLEEAKKLADAHNIPYEKRHQIGDILLGFFETFAEDQLVQPTFIINYPIEISPLAKRMPENEKMVERFELFILGREHANAFSELNDPIDQRKRFEHQMELRRQGDEEACELDEDFLTALEYGMPPTGGMGMGIDRLVMFLTGQDSIRDVLLFPTMKPIKEG